MQPSPGGAQGTGGTGRGAGGTTAGGVPAPPPRVAPALPPGIIISPWQGDIDLNTKQGKAIWDEGITPVEEKFTGQGKDLVRFLADVSNQVSKCLWKPILTINNKYLLTQYGEITMQEVEAARATRRATPIVTLADARPQINALMMFHFIYKSLGPLPRKKLNTRLEEIDQDGPVLLKIVLDDTFVATNASTFTIKEQFYDLHLKKYKWNVQSMNQDVREKCADLKAAGHASHETDLLIALFRAYSTSTNEEFKNAVLFWKNEWDSQVFASAEDLMKRADSKYVELRSLGTWGKKSDADDQLIALTAKVDQLMASPPQTSTFKPSSKETTKTTSAKKETPKWKFDRTLSSGTTLEKNGKTYHWCTGPGHKGIPMWTIHKPNTCGKPSQQGNSNKPAKQGKSAFNLEAMAAELTAQGFSADEVTSKMEAIMAVIES